jgi:hypothetical protein
MKRIQAYIVYSMMAILPCGCGTTASIVSAAAAAAAATAAVGVYIDRQEKDANQTAKTYNYQPDQGVLVKIEDVRVEPAVIVPGKSSKLVMSYAVLDADAGKGIEVTEKRSVMKGSGLFKDIGPKKVTRKPGTYYTEQEVTFPKDLQEGKYALKAEVEVAGKTDAQQALFEVRIGVGGE